ncbi:IS66 family transposase zinc-finger binding domain-containing protein [Bradyrhizobium sp. 14AA]
MGEVLDVVPAILRVLRTIRHKYACRGWTGQIVCNQRSVAPPGYVPLPALSRSSAKLAWGRCHLRQLLRRGR